jgi:hypothetical protein
MANLTTLGGLQISFDPDSLAAIADHDSNTGKASTTIYGVTKAEIHIAESVEAFLARIGLAAKFAKLTRPNGTPVWINGGAVSSLRPPLPGEYLDAVKTVISMEPLTQGVKEVPEHAKAMLNAHGGKL